MNQAAEIMRMLTMASFQATQTKVEFGELSAYDPTTHTGRFLLPMVLDTNDNPQETAFIPIGTMYTGEGYGMQFVPCINAQAMVIFVDHHGYNPVCAVFMFNTAEAPPFTDGKTQGWQDSQGNKVITTIDGKASGDGEGAARMVGAGYASVTAPEVCLGADGLSFPAQGQVRQKDLQEAINGVIMVTQTAIDALAAMVQHGSGVTPPTIAPVTAEASTTVAAND